MAATKRQWAVVLGLMLDMAAAGAGLWAYQPQSKQPPEKQKSKAREPEPPRNQEEPSARTDRYSDPLPEGAIARLGSVRLRAVGARVGVSADGKTIISVTRGRQVKIWDAETGKLRERRELPIQLAYEAYLSSDGRLLAACEADSNPTLDVWDVLTGKRLHRLPRGNRAAFSPDSKTLAVAEPAGAGKFTIRLTDMA